MALIGPKFLMKVRDSREDTIKSDWFILTANKKIYIYRTRAIITRSWLETALVYKPRILGLKNEEFSFLVHKWSVI